MLIQRCQASGDLQEKRSRYCFSICSFYSGHHGNEGGTSSRFQSLFLPPAGDLAGMVVVTGCDLVQREGERADLSHHLTLSTFLRFRARMVRTQLEATGGVFVPW